MWPILKQASVADSFTEQQNVRNMLTSYTVDHRVPFHMAIDRLCILYAQYEDAAGSPLTEGAKVPYLD
ncbi:unnamed protein product [Parajaminaea phylloscopi]